ncbi:MAG: hypothetical protein ACJ72T_06090 [Nitrososphaeraceae archaeon]
MQTRALISFAVIAAVLIIGASSLRAVTNTINSSNNNQFLQQVFATHMDSANSTEKTILHQKIIHFHNWKDKNLENYLYVI